MKDEKVAYILGYSNSCGCIQNIIVFAFTIEEAIQILGLTERDDYDSCIRDSNYDHLYEKFKMEGYIPFNTKKGQQIYYDNEWNNCDSSECIECNSSEWDMLPESTIFEIGYDPICYSCLDEEYLEEIGEFKVLEAYKELKRSIQDV